jgi:hypothetical protein
MSANDTAADNGHGDEQSVDDRTRRAVAETLTVLTPDGTPVEDPDRICFSVTSASGATYIVNLASDDCDCADAEYRAPAGGCKHVRRARLATGRDAVPATVDADDQLGEHVATAATDGGVVPEAETDHAEIVDDDDDADPWNGPFSERDRYGQPTGARYVRCRSCGVEVLADHREAATHAGDCPHRDA